MPIDTSTSRMGTLSKYPGTIGIEGERRDAEIVVRIPMDHDDAADLYYRLLVEN